MDEPSHRGPFLSVAVLAPQAATSPNGRLTGLNGVTDYIQFPNQGTDEMPAMVVKLQLVVVLVAGEARGKSFTVAIQSEAPSGKRSLRQDYPIEFHDRAESPATITFEIPAHIDEEGPHWFDVILAPRGPDQDEEERLLTRVPLTISYQRDGTDI